MKKIIILFAFCKLFTVSCFSQTLLTVDSALIFFSSNAEIFVCGGGITLQNNATIDNSGLISLTGNWTNNAGNTGLINSSLGIVIFSGDTQNIQGTDTTLFYDLSLKAQVLNT